MSKDKYIYDDPDLEQFADWIEEREEFKETGISNQVSYSKTGSFTMGTAFAGGLIATIFLYGPVFALFVLCNDVSQNEIVHFMSFENVFSGTEGFNPMAFLFTSFVVILAILGGASIVGWLFMLGASSNDDKWYENEIKKSEKMCDIALQEAEKPLKAEIDSLNSKLLNSDIKYNKLVQEYNDLKTEFMDNSALFKREKKLWALEKKELQYQIKLKQGLVDDIDDSDSPLGGLYD